MKTMTIDVSDRLYREFQEYAHKVDRPTSELIREAMQLYRDERIRPRQSLRALKPLSLGKVLRPLEPDDDLLEEVLRE